MVGLALAVVATIALVLAQDIRYLRLGIVAALWAALVGAFFAVRYRRQAVSTDDAVAQAQEVYELELEREIAARREFELEIEAEARQRAETDSRAELDALRAEVGALRDNLQSLFSGEVLLERLQLTAQATRMRALHEEQRLVESRPAGKSAPNRPALTAGKEADGADRPTDLIERVREKQARPEPRRSEVPVRRVANGEPLAARENLGAGPAASLAKAAAEARAAKATFQARATPPPPPPRRKAEPPKPEATELTRPAFGRSRAERSRPALNPLNPVKEPAKPNPVEQPTQLAKPVDADWAASWEKRGAGQPAASPDRDPSDDTQVPPRPPAEPPRRAVARSTEKREAEVPERNKTAPLTRRIPEKLAEPPRREEPSMSNPTLPEEARRLAQEGRSGGRRRRAVEDTPPAAPAASAAESGRRRRSEGEPPSWRQPAPAETGRRRAGLSRPEMEPVSTPEPAPRRAGLSRPEMEPARRAGLSRPEMEPAPRRSGLSRPEIEPVSNSSSAPNGRRAAPEETGEGGSHSAGLSVSELLAAHGTSATPRRRRRAED